MLEDGLWIWVSVLVALLVVIFWNTKGKKWYKKFKNK